jgi:hypothetical protein
MVGEDLKPPFISLPVKRSGEMTPFPRHNLDCRKGTRLRSARISDSAARPTDGLRTLLHLHSKSLVRRRTDKNRCAKPAGPRMCAEQMSVSKRCVIPPPAAAAVPACALDESLPWWRPILDRRPASRRSAGDPPPICFLTQHRAEQGGHWANVIERQSWTLVRYWSLLKAIAPKEGGHRAN